MLGDTGVAVSPKDHDKDKFVGAKVKLPIVDREIPIFSDFYVDARFRLGLREGHSGSRPNDFAMGERMASRKSISSTKPPTWLKATANLPA